MEKMNLRSFIDIQSSYFISSRRALFFFDDDVKETFRYSKDHPDVTEDFSFVIVTYFIVPVG